MRGALEMGGPRFAREQRDRVLLDNRVHHEGASRYPLALGAVAGMDDHGLGVQLEPDGAAGASAFMRHNGGLP